MKMKNEPHYEFVLSKQHRMLPNDFSFVPKFVHPTCTNYFSGIEDESQMLPLHKSNFSSIYQPVVDSNQAFHQLQIPYITPKQIDPNE